MPTIDTMFRDCPKLKAALLQAGFTSVAQISLMPREALMEINGLKPSSVAHISRRLREYGIEHRMFSQKLTTFIDEHFSCVEDAPIGLLQVVVTRSGTVSRSVFAPIELIALLETIDPGISVVEVMSKSRDGLRCWIQSLMDDGVQLHSLDEDLRHLSARLGYFDLTFTETEIKLPVFDGNAEIPTIPYRLHSVS